MNAGQKAALYGALTVGALCGLGTLAGGQSEVHGRKYQPPPSTGHIVITVQKSFNEKPLENAAVIFHATKGGKDNGTLEIKTNSQGKATMDLLETGSHVRVQVIAGGYATAAQEFDVTETDTNLLIKMQRPRAQISVYADNDGKAATTQPGIQEADHRVTSTVKPTTAVVSGTLKDEHGGRIPGGIVRLHPTTAAGAEASLATDAEGNFRFDRIAPGAYDLQMSAPGYAGQMRHLALGAGDSEIYKETLHPATGPGAPGPGAPNSGAPNSGAPARSPLPQPASGPQ